MGSLKIEGYYIRPKKKGTAWTVTHGASRFTLKRITEDSWKVSGKSSDGSYRRLWIDVDADPEDEVETLRRALVLAGEKLLGIRPLLSPINSDPNLLGVADVFEQWLEIPLVEDATKEKSKVAWKKFGDFLIEQEGVGYWKDIRRSHAEKYLAGLSRTKRKVGDEEVIGYSYHYLYRLYQPIRQCVLWASRNWPEAFHDFTSGVRVPDKDERTYQDDGAFLPFEQLVEFLLWLRDQPDGWEILPAVALGGLVGLRIDSEVYRLPWQDIDLVKGTVTIRTGKNKYSARRIPVATLVLAILRSCPQRGEKVVSAFAHYSGFSRAVSRLLEKWNPDLVIPPMNLRKTLESEAGMRNWAGYAFNRYLGRAPATIQERHYQRLSKTQVEEAMREHVIDKLDPILEPGYVQWNRTGGKVVNLVG